MRHAVRTVIILVAAGMILIAVMFVGLELLKGRAGRGALSAWHWVLSALLVVAGIVLVWKSNALAQTLTDDFD